MVRLSAPILTRVPAFTGSIEVDITAEDLPSGDPRQNALFGMCYPSIVHQIIIMYSSNCYCPFCIVILSIIIDEIIIQNGMYFNFVQNTATQNITEWE